MTIKAGRVLALAVSASCVAVVGCGPVDEPQAASVSPVRLDVVSASSMVPRPEANGQNALLRHTKADFGRFTPSEAARYVADRVTASGDADGLPFLIVDKVRAQVFAFEPGGRVIDSAPALLGLAKGDDSIPGIGERKIADIRPEERTTPAGRFAAEMGENSHGDDILWVDYDNAVSMHRVRPIVAAERRLQRLASDTPDDNRISYGCINLPPAFYDSVVRPLFTPRNGIVYVLPETRPATTLFANRPVASAR